MESHLQAYQMISTYSIGAKEYFSFVMVILIRPPSMYYTMQAIFKLLSKSFLKRAFTKDMQFISSKVAVISRLSPMEIHN